MRYSFLHCDCLARCHRECPRGHRFDNSTTTHAAERLRRAEVRRSARRLFRRLFGDVENRCRRRWRRKRSRSFPRGKTIAITGGDARGLIYGALALREQLLNGTPIEQDRSASREKPALPFRGIKFNTPWDTYRPSSALDQHYATARDLKFWEAWLDMMVENRFNAFTLWTMHPFTYMVRPKNFPEASKWSDAEFAEWQHLYREIFRMAKERGLDTYVVFWSIFVSEEFAKAHDVAKENFYPHYYVHGDTSDITKRYLRESVTQMLEEYPDLDGIGVSHGEGMAGMTPLARQQFVDEVYIAGALNAKRKQPVKLIHRVPFSSGLSSGPGVSTDVEKITRAAMEKLGNKFAGPIWVEMKFNWSHGHSTPKLVKVHGGKLGDTYFKPAPSNYKVVWQVRNEDFFALRWGVPDFIRQHIALNGTQDYVGGYFVGSETYIPALDYFTARERARRLEMGVPAPVAVLQTLGPPALRPEDAGRGVPGRVHAPLRQARREPAAGLLARVQHADAARVAVRLALGLHALRRGHARAAGRAHELHRRRRAHQPADDGSGVRLGRRLREDHARRRHLRRRSHHAAATRRPARTRLPRGAAAW